MEKNKHIPILLVEDNLGDIKLITDALEETAIRPEVHLVRDGIEAIQFLRRKAPFEGAPKPAVVILDLNLPSKDGRTVLAEVKSDPSLASVPIIVYSGSDAPQDISTCYALHANCYIVKPRDLLNINETIRSLVDFWLQRVALPPDPNPYDRLIAGK